MRRTSGCTSPKGFSLLELIIAMGIMGVVTTVGMAMLFRLYSAWQADEAGAALELKAVQVFAQLRSDLEAVAPGGLSGVAAPVVAEIGHVPRQEDSMRGLLASDRIELCAMAGSPPSLRRIVYSVDRDQDELVRSEAAWASSSGEGAVILEGVVHFRLSYAGPEGNWEEAWPHSYPPRLVRLTLVVRHPEKPSEKISRVAVFPIPTAQRGKT